MCRMPGCRPIGTMGLCYQRRVTLHALHIECFSSRLAPTYGLGKGLGKAQFGGSPNIPTDDILLGQNFAIIAEPNNRERISYYILKCQRAKFVVSVAFTCIWGNRFQAGDHAMEGIYYQKWGRGTNFVYLNASNAAYLLFYLVRAKGFQLVICNHLVQGTSPTFQLSEDHHQQIVQTLGLRSPLTCRSLAA